MKLHIPHTHTQAEQSMEASHHMRSSEEAQARMEELLERNRALEEETMTQKHLIHLEKLKAEREYEEIKEEKTRLMTDLEQERNKLVADIQQLNKNKVRLAFAVCVCVCVCIMFLYSSVQTLSLQVLRTTASRHESTVSPASNEPTMRGSEMVRLAMMLQEASAISKSFNRPLVRSAHHCLTPPDARLCTMHCHCLLYCHIKLQDFSDWHTF